MTLPVRRRVAVPRDIVALTRGRVADSACFLTMKETDQEDVATEIQKVMLLCLDQQGKVEGNLRTSEERPGERRPWRSHCRSLSSHGWTGCCMGCHMGRNQLQNALDDVRDILRSLADVSKDLRWTSTPSIKSIKYVKDEGCRRTAHPARCSCGEPQEHLLGVPDCEEWGPWTSLNKGHSFRPAGT